MKVLIKDFFSKRDQIHKKLRIWSHLLKKSLMKNFIFCAVSHPDLVNSAVPRTTRATKTKTWKPYVVKRKKKIDALEVSEIVLRNKIKSKTELLNLAKKQKEKGKTDYLCMFSSTLKKFRRSLILHGKWNSKLKIWKGEQYLGLTY